MKQSVIIEPSELSPQQIKRLMSLGYTWGWYKCPCGSCDPERALLKNVECPDMDVWEDEHIYDAEGEIKNCP